MRRHLTKGIATLFLTFTAGIAFSQGFTTEEYKKALWMTTRMYGGQRSGANNWFIYNHLPKDINASLRGMAFINDQDTDGYDLSGGWHDCGDHVKFGQTEFYSAYMLLKAYAEFPAGYDDYYAQDYKSYGQAGDWSWEGGKHGPDGIPDILNEVKHATDFFIKCTRSASVFYFQVGQGGPDHKEWVTAVQMQTLSKDKGGQPRSVFKNPNDASMPSFAGATLALMARLYKKFDPAYSQLCLTHALYAYQYAKAHPGTVPDADPEVFYDANDNWKDDYATMCAELFWATGNGAYKTEALSFSVSDSPGQGTDIFGKSYGFDYSNNGDIAVYNLALLGKPNAKTVMDNIIKKHYLANVLPDGQFAGGNQSWGPLRYNANTALMVALWQKLFGTDAVPHKYIYDNIDYILGKNSANQSFVVGFGAKSPKFPHHRNLFLRDDNPADNIKRSMPIPLKNQQAGILVGGTRSPGTYLDDLITVTHTEGGIDYNACLVGVLAFINSKLAPVDTTKFGNPTPDLGPTQSICGKKEIILDSKIASDGKKTFTWLKDGVTVSQPSVTASTYKVTEPGQYTCKLDSAGKWSTSATVEISAVLPEIKFESTAELCSPASKNLVAGVATPGVSYVWTRNGAVIKDALQASYTVYSEGTYRATVSASGCPSRFGEIKITSVLPFVSNDTLCKAGEANLKVSGPGQYEWYDRPEDGTVLETGNNYRPQVTSSKVFYVKDAGTMVRTAGPSSTGNTLSGMQNGGPTGIRFTAQKAFLITQMKILPYVYSCNANDKVTFQVQLKQNGVTLGTYTAEPVPCTGVQTTAPLKTFYTALFSTPINVPAAGSYELIPTNSGNTTVWFSGGADFAAYDAPGIMDLTDDTRSETGSFPGIFDIRIQTGSICERAPVFAVVDPSVPCRITTELESAAIVSEEIKIYPNPSASEFIIESATGKSLKVYDETGKLVKETLVTGVLILGSELKQGIYHVVFFENGRQMKTINLIKN